MKPFWKENWKGVVFGSAIVLLFIGALAWWTYQALRASEDYASLIAKGQRIAGTIVHCQLIEPNPEDSSRSRRGPYLLAVIEYELDALGVQRFSEVWPPDLYRHCQEGSPVGLYYLKDNRRVQVASVHRPGMRKRTASHP